MDGRGRMKVLAICGSQRIGSYNQKLLDFASQILTTLEIEVSPLSIAENLLPMFSQDILPTTEVASIVSKIGSQVVACDGVIISSPQINGSIPPILKNLVDWISSHRENEGDAQVFKHKVICLMGAARGDGTCLGGLAHLSAVFGHLGAVIVPQYYSVSQVEKVISDGGNISDEKVALGLKNYLSSFSSLLAKF